MPNAKDLKGDETSHNFLLVGTPGSGKSTQYLTLPGRGFIYIFDSSALASIEGMDVDYEDFLPDALDINVVPLRKSTDPSKGEKPRDKVFKAKEPTAYTEWEKHFEDALESKFFDNYDWIGFDSYTTFADAVMDRVLWLNGRLGKQPEQDDWSTQMVTIRNVSRTITALGKVWIATAHEEPIKDELTQRVFWQPLLTGKLKTRIPLLFSNIWRTESDGDSFFFKTRNDRQHPFARCAIKGLENEIDCSVPDAAFKDLTTAQNYGLGKILKTAGYFSHLDSQRSSKKVSSKQTRK